MRLVIFAAVLSGIASMATASPMTYLIDPTHSASRFGYHHLGWTWQEHRFDQTTGRITLDRAARSGSVEVSIDARSVNTGYPLFNSQLQAEEFFDTARHPHILFRSTQVRFEGERPVAVEGELTIKGITHPVTLALSSFVAGPHPVQKKREALGANATARIKRSDFGMSKQVPLVADEVSLSFTVQAFKE